MKNPEGSNKAGSHDLRVWVAGLAVISLALFLSACGSGTPGSAVGSSQPTLNSIQPTSGPSTGNTVVTFSGANFEFGLTVTFGGIPGTSVMVISSAQFTAVTPAHAAGTVDVVVTNPTGASSTLANGFTYNIPPTITAISPAVGSITGGTSVTITGTGFQSGATVTFGGAAATIVSVTATQIVVTTAAHAAGTVNVTVTNPDGSTVTQTAGFLYGLPPSITNVTPNTGPAVGGTIVTITGAEFQPGATVTFAGISATNVVVAADAQTIQATTPAHAAGSVDVTVKNPDGRSATLAGGFSYSGIALTISGIAPASGPTTGGTAVTLTGTDFLAGATVTFAGTIATSIVVVSATQITCNTPPHTPSGAVDVVVTNLDGSQATLTAGYTYTVPASKTPTITNISPASGTTAGGTVVTITGTLFQQNLTVTFGTAAGTNVSVTTDGTGITVTTPAQPAGAVDVTVTNPDTTTVTATKGYTYTNPPPSITSIDPTSGPTAGGTVVTINGSNFLNGATVTFGGIASPGVTFVTSAQLTATTPASAAGTVDVTVTNPDSQSATLPAAFTYITSTMQIITTTLAVGNPTAPYYTTLLPGGGTPPYSWSIPSGTLPAGLSLSSSTGVISGIPTTNGTSNFTAQLTDSSLPLAQTATAALAITIESPPLAALPAVFLDTTFPDTTNYTVVHVPAGGDFQAALNAASCNPTGTVIELASGATYSTGKTKGFLLPQTTCASGQWIIIRTDTADSNLPPPDTRIDPSYSPILAKIFTTGVNPAVSTASNASHYWFMGVEIGMGPSVTANFGVFVVGNGETDATLLPDHIYVDRVYLHGNATGNTQRGYGMNGAYLASVNSYYENIHYVGVDSQAIGAWNGTGPFKIVNNELDGSGENILWGGAKPTILNNIQQDIEIRRNHFFKPLTWYPSDPSYGGIHFEVKNWLEFKSAQRVLVEGNVFENEWADAQAGFGFQFTPRSVAVCPLCTVSDIVVRYNIVRHTSSVYNFAGEDNTNPPSGVSNHIIIHDNLVTDVNGATWGGDGDLLQFVNGAPGTGLLPLHDITFDHNTSFQSHFIWIFTNNRSNPMANVVFTNNIQPHGTNGGIFGSGSAEGTTSLNDYLENYTVTNNVIDALPSKTSASVYPSGNFFPPDFSQANVGFVDYAGGDFRLCTVALCGFDSPFHNAGTDGRDLGADVSAINAGTAGVIP